MRLGTKYAVPMFSNIVRTRMERRVGKEVGLKLTLQSGGLTPGVLPLLGKLKHGRGVKLEGFASRRCNLAEAEQ